MKRLSENRKDSYVVILGVCLLVVIYTTLHDQYIVRIAAEHFTVYHEPLWGITDPIRLAAAYGFSAGLVPGLVLGLACAVVGLHGERRPLRVTTIFTGAVGVILLVEVTSAASGGYVFFTRRPLYPERIYPDASLPLMITQTIQITCYLTSAAFSGLFLLLLHRRRKLLLV